MIHNHELNGLKPITQIKSKDFNEIEMSTKCECRYFYPDQIEYFGSTVMAASQLLVNECDLASGIDLNAVYTFHRSLF